MTSYSSTRNKLFIMMVLELLIWGAWLPLIWTYMGSGLGFSAGQQFWVGAAFAVSSVLGIFFSNQFADRNFAAEKFMAFSHLVGGLAIMGLYFVKSFWPFFGLMLVHSLLYVPTLSVANSIAFAHLKDSQREYGLVRMGGTVGWILASWPMHFILGNAQAEAVKSAYASIFLVAGIASLVLAAFSLTLPHTPPRPAHRAEDRLAWLEAMKVLRRPYVSVLYGITLLDAIMLNGYFVVTGGFLLKAGFSDANVMPVMSVGQVAELLTMGVLGWFLKRMGWKLTMILGIAGHAVRFTIFALFPDNHPIIIAAQLLHGICYAFFFATVYIFIDTYFPKDARTSAQGLFNLLIFGIGDILAKWLFLWLQTALTHDGTIDYRTLFLIPTGMSIFAVLVMALFFHPPSVAEGEEGLAAA